MNRVRLFLAFGVLGGTLLAFLGGMLVARRAMRPIAGLTRAAREVARTRDPDITLPKPQANDEVADLAHTFEDMLRELSAAREETEATLARQRKFVADASHELRTPLTSILANLELLEAELAGEQRDMADSALRSSRRMRRLVGDLLLLARADAGREAPSGIVDLAAIAAEAAREAGALSSDHPVALDVPEPVTVNGISDDLHRLAGNLIENALLHTPAGTPGDGLGAPAGRPGGPRGVRPRAGRSARHARARVRALRPRRRRRRAERRQRSRARHRARRHDLPRRHRGAGRRRGRGRPLRRHPSGGRRHPLRFRSYRVGATRPRPRNLQGVVLVKSLLRRRPSPALIIAVIALFISLSGVSYGVATGFIDSREIQNNQVRSVDIRNNEIRTRDLRNNEVRGIDIRNSTIQSRDIAINAVRGEDVREDTLAKVPSALLADSATSATNADGVGTLKIIPRTSVAEGAAPSMLATHGPLTLSGACAPGPTAAARASTPQDRLGQHEFAVNRRPGDRDADDFRARPPTPTSPRSIAEAPGRVQCHAVLDRVRDTPSGSGFSGERRNVHRLDRRRLLPLPRLARAAGLDLDDDRQDHRAPLEALVDELGHVVVEVVLHEVDLGDLLLG